MNRPRQSAPVCLSDACVCRFHLVLAAHAPGSDKWKYVYVPVTYNLLRKNIFSMIHESTYLLAEVFSRLYKIIIA